jgi:leucine-rich PPR motif-containing protein
MELQDEMKTLGVGSQGVAMGAIIRGLAHSRKTDNAIRILDIMLEMRIVPTVATHGSQDRDLERKIVRF